MRLDLHVDATGVRVDDGHDCFIPKRCVHKFTGHGKGVQRVLVFPDYGHLMLSASLDGTCKVWDVLNDKRCLRTYVFGRRPLTRRPPGEPARRRLGGLNIARVVPLARADDTTHTQRSEASDRQCAQVAYGPHPMPVDLLYRVPGSCRIRLDNPLRSASAPHITPDSGASIHMHTCPYPYIYNAIHILYP